MTTQPSLFDLLDYRPPAGFKPLRVLVAEK